MLKSNQNSAAREIGEDLVHVNRVTKVVKGGRNFSFSAIVIAGDENGRVGYGTGKAKEVSQARIKASKDAKKSMISVALYKGRTIHHDIIGKSGAAKVVLRRASAGTGVIAGGPLRSLFIRLGIKDIVCKSIGTNNPRAMINAAMDALQNLDSPDSVAKRRGKAVSELLASA